MSAPRASADVAGQGGAPCSPRVSCDSMAATGARTRSGSTIFAKNSDRPAAECQPLFHAPRRRGGGTVSCQSLVLDDLDETLAFVGARPWWLWGLEHGVNEKGVAVGNHTIFTRDPVAETGLLGMDLVRLALERGHTAAGAVEVLISLVERHGQGGSGYFDTWWPYHNSFLVADAKEVLLLEVSASRWALRRTGDGALSASNHVTIGTDWDRVGHDTIEHAIALDWWPHPTGVRFDFAAAYRSTDVVPPVVSSGRYAATCRALGAGPLDLASTMRAMRDHYDGGEVHLPGAMPDDERYFSVCMHADPVGTTTASMVVELGPQPSSPVLAWVAMGSPCVCPYLPVIVGAPLPAEMEQGGQEPSSGGAWHRFHALLAEVEKDFPVRGRYVRDFWRDFEAGLFPRLEAAVAALPPAGEDRDAAAGQLVADAWARASEALASLTERVRAL